MQNTLFFYNSELTNVITSKLYMVLKYWQPRKILKTEKGLSILQHPKINIMEQ